MKKLIFYVLVILAFQCSLKAQTIVTVGGTGANYSTLKLAFDAINSGALTGTIEIQITGNTTETLPAILNTTGGSANYTSVSIYPTGTGYTIRGTIASPLVDLNGADNVTFDGRINRIGSAQDLTITNSSISNAATTSTIRLWNGATNNIIRYCNIRGSSAANKGGNILFYTSSATLGNINITIENNNVTSNNGFRPVNLIYSAGSASKPNSNIRIQNNSFYDFFKANQASYGIFLSSLNSNWTISGNSFYETGVFSSAVNTEYDVIRINCTTGGGFDITGNFIGGNAPLCGGSAWSKNSTFDNSFYAIKLSFGNYSTNSVHGNIISNFNWRNSGNASWTGINIDAGSVNIGTVTGNTIGAATGTGSIIVTGGISGLNLYGINIANANTVNCQNNIIGSITASNSNSANAANVYAISKGAYLGNTTISNNTIGSTTTPNSINASSSSSGNNQYVVGISNSSPGIIAITNNIIANLKNSTNNTTSSANGRVSGIYSTAGNNTITNNQIYDLTISNNNNAIDQDAAVSGISISGTNSANTVTGNTIYNLVNDNSSFTGDIIGLFFGGGSGNNRVSENFIHSLSTNVSSTLSTLIGIKAQSGLTTYSNNIISLGGNVAATIYGIFETSTSGSVNNLYFNTVYIGGISSAGTSKSYSLFNDVSSYSRNLRNNLFVNSRSTPGGSDLHYSLYIVSAGGTLVCDYNDYFISGTGGTLGYYGANRTTLPIVAGNDANSSILDPAFISAGSTNASDYQIGIDLNGVTIPEITTDYGSNPRITPTIGAWERLANRWKGTLSVDWNTPGNWTGNVLPAGTDPSIVFDADPDRPCYLDQDRSVTNITNAQSTDRLVTNGHKLTVKGNLNFTNGAQIEASATASAVEFAGTIAQSIPADAFYNNQIYDLIINNANNVTLNGTLNLLNNSSSLSGVLDANTASPTLIYGGTAAQTIAVGTFLDSTIFNLTIDNSVGVSLNSLIRVNNTLTINPGRIFSVNPTGRATINSLVNNGILNLNSGSASDIFSMIINNYSGSGTTNAQLFITGGGAPYYNWHYVAEPFVNGISTTFLTNINARNLLSYDDSRVVTTDYNGWMYFNGYGGTSGIAAGPGFTTLDFRKGYNFYNGTNATATFTASTAIGTTLGIIPLQYSGAAPGNAIYGLNLLGNSLTCSIDWDKVTLNGSVGSAVYYTTGNRWATYLQGGSGGINGGTKDIPPLQGFFVKANDVGASIDLSAAREHSFQPRYKKSGNQEMSSKGGTIYSKVKLELSGAETSDETIVWYPDDATTGFDEKFDANKMFASEAVFSQVYTIMEGQNYAINGIPLPTDSIIVPLGAKFANAGAYSLLKKEYVSPDGYDIFLIDKANNNFTVNLKNNNEYQFSTEAGTFTDRFFLKVLSVVTGIEDPEIENKDFNIYCFQGIVNIVPMSSTIYSSKGEIRVFDLTGRVIKQLKNVEWYEGTPVQVPCKNEQGIYLVEITSGAKRFVGKVFLP